MTGKVFSFPFGRFLGVVLFLLGIPFVFFLNGCASKNEVVKLQYDLNSTKRQVMSIKKDVEKLTNLLQESEKKTGELEGIITAMKDDVEGFVYPMRKNQADINAGMDELRTELQSLHGRIEESQHLISRQREGKSSFEERYVSDLSAINASLSELKNRILVVEGFFISDGKSPPKKESKKKTREGKTATSDKPNPKELYEKAYGDFRKGKIRKARAGFQRHLSLFPNTEYSDNAQYWIGESFYLEKKYKEAIIEFEEVIKKYPRGNKTPSALLKQGLSFYRLGDKTSAGLLLEKLIKDYPDSNQAKIAKKELKTLR